jgi:hypothetical protein
MKGCVIKIMDLSDVYFRKLKSTYFVHRAHSTDLLSFNPVSRTCLCRNSSILAGKKMLSFTELNNLDYDIFIDVMGNVIEHCPVLSAALWRCRPFDSIENLLEEMEEIVDQLPKLGKRI